MVFNFDDEDGDEWSHIFYAWLSNGDDPSVSI